MVILNKNNNNDNDNNKDKKGKDFNGENNSSSLVKVNGNKIYFYSSVGEKSVLALNQALSDLSISLPFQAAKAGTSNPRIALHINSFGGYLTDGMAALDCLKNCPLPVDTYIDGAAASAATLFSVAGDRRYIGAHSVMMIHQLSSWTMGQYEQIKDEMKNLDQWMKIIKSIYKKYTKVPTAKIDEILKHDLWFDAQKCKKLGLVDEVL